MDDKNITNYLNITKFNFYQDPMKTSKAWVNLHLNNATKDPQDYADLLFLLNFTSADMDNLLFGEKSKFKAYIYNNVF